MNILGEKSLSALVKWLLDLIFIGGIGITLSLPWTLKWYLNLVYYRNDLKMYFFFLALLVVTGILALSILHQIRKIFKTLKRKDPFTMDNVMNLKRMGWAAFLISFCYIFKIVFYNSFLTIILVMVFVIAGFFSIILAEVFRQAVEAKQENDFTI